MEETLSEPVFDRDTILTLVEGDIEFLSEIVELFFDDFPGMLSDNRATGNAFGQTRLCRLCTDAPL